jgi:hypothetical protein
MQKFPARAILRAVIFWPIALACVAIMYLVSGTALALLSVILWLVRTANRSRGTARPTPPQTERLTHGRREKRYHLN